MNIIIFHGKFSDVLTSDSEQDDDDNTMTIMKMRMRMKNAVADGKANAVAGIGNISNITEMISHFYACFFFASPKYSFVVRIKHYYHIIIIIIAGDGGIIMEKRARNI